MSDTLTPGEAMRLAGEAIDREIAETKAAFEQGGLEAAHFAAWNNGYSTGTGQGFLTAEGVVEKRWKADLDAAKAQVAEIRAQTLAEVDALIRNDALYLPWSAEYQKLEPEPYAFRPWRDALAEFVAEHLGPVKPDESQRES